MHTSEAARRRTNVILQAEGAPSVLYAGSWSAFAASSVSRPRCPEETLRRRQGDIRVRLATAKLPVLGRKSGETREHRT